MDYRYGSHTVFKIQYHFVFVTKYRYKVLKGDVGLKVRELIRQTCEAFEIEILKLDVQVFILTFKNSKLRIMKFMFLRLFYVVSNKIKHNTLIYNKLKLLLFNLKSTSYKNLNIE